MAAAVAQRAAERELFVAGELVAANRPNKLAVSVCVPRRSPSVSAKTRFGSPGCAKTVNASTSLSACFQLVPWQRSDPRALKVRSYVTVGSPLAIRAIRDRLRPIGYPKPAVATWYNAYDPKDVVALYPLDAQNFPVNPTIENYGKVLNGTDNRHGIIGYLDDADVAKHILDALQA
jgi:hypothetical protein